MTLRYRLCVLLLALGCMLPAAPLAAQAGGPGSELTVYLATMGPGDQVWEMFGHNAIWISDRTTGTTIVYNYGVFDETQPGFIPRLMKGRMLYRMDISDADYEINKYRALNRTLTLQRLNMTAAQKHALREFLEWNWLPENREYLYDPFRDNCSTRVRDALDRTLGGTIASTLRGVSTGTTYRSHSVRLTARDILTYTGLYLGLGMPTDQPIDAREASFIPMELMRHMRSVQVLDADGDSVPLIADETVVVPADRDDPPDTPPNRTGAYFVAGVLIGAILVLLARAAVTRPRVRLALAVALSFWGVLTGFLGMLLTLLWLLTDHTYAHANVNLLQVSPFGFLLAVAAPLAVLGRDRGRLHASARLAIPTAVVLLALSAAGVVLLLLPGTVQANAPIVALALPIHLAVVLTLFRTKANPPSSAEDDRVRRAA